MREYSINSTVRNIRATKALLGDDISYVYIYTPTFFNCETSDSQTRELMFSNRAIVLGDWQVLEEDFRKELLKKLSTINEIKVLDFSGVADTKTWFQDDTHYNSYGENKFSELIYPEISKIVRSIIN